MRTKAVIVCALTFGASCAHVSQQDLDSRLGELRTGLETRMDEGDARLSRRVDGIEGTIAALRAELETLESDFGVRVEELEAALRFNVPVHFGFDRAEVPEAGRAVLDRFSSVALAYYPEARITVEGFTDSSGSVDYNLRLGKRRAEAVKDYLVQGGLPGERVRTVSYGKSVDRQVAPDARGPGTAGWENRRVVLVIDHAGSAGARPVAEGGGA